MKHKEAFCVMIYECQECGYSTFFWNSRDGVTAFATSCVLDGCDGEMYHEFFGSDTPLLELPKRASHVWVDMTIEKALDWVDLFWEANGESMMEAYPHLKEIGEEGLRKSKVEEIYHEGDAPCLLTRIEYMRSK